MQYLKNLGCGRDGQTARYLDGEPGDMRRYDQVLEFIQRTARRRGLGSTTLMAALRIDPKDLRRRAGKLPSALFFPFLMATVATLWARVEILPAGVMTFWDHFS